VRLVERDPWTNEGQPDLRLILQRLSTLSVDFRVGDEARRNCPRRYLDDGDVSPYWDPGQKVCADGEQRLNIGLDIH